MSMAEAPADLSSFFDAAEITLDAIESYTDQIFETARSWEKFSELTSAYAQKAAQGEGDALKAGIALLLLGRCQKAQDMLSKAGEGKYKHYYAALAAAGLNQHAEAKASYQRAADAGWDRFEIDMLVAELFLKTDDEDEAEKLINLHQNDGQDRGEWYFLQGLVKERRHENEAALVLYEKALALSPDHVKTMFHAAWLYDLTSDDEQAIELYVRLASQPRAHVNALINLAVIYEDLGKYEDAMRCLQRVLKAYPNHTRARLFLKDIESSREMVIDDAREKQVETRNRLLETPINEFELSVRARNCLKKMNIQTLGDLLMLTEAELMSYKNFGETSLQEINALLVKRGLHLGLNPDEIDPAVLAAPPETPKVTVPPGSEALLAKPVSELELSVRARRCLQRLNIDKLGDLIQKTEAELLATRNFGATSLVEIKSRLTDFGLNLANRG